MNKIPVGQTIAQSYQFTFRKYFALLSVIWLPLLLMAAYFYLLIFPLFQRMATSAGMGRAPGALGAVFAMEAFVYVLIAVISVGITKEALGVRKGPWFIYLSVGLAELRVLGGYVVLAVVSFVCSLVLGFGIGIVLGIVIAARSGAGAGADPAASARLAAVLMPVLMTAIFVPLIYFWIRLSSFLTVVAVAEHRFGLWRSWTLTRGNVWRLLAILLVVLIPLIALEFLVGGFAFGDIFEKMTLTGPTTPQEAQAFSAAMVQAMAQRMPLLMLAFLPFSPFLYGLMTAPPAFAYRALVPSGADAAAAFD